MSIDPQSSSEPSALQRKVFLQGNFGPVFEERTETQLKVTGRIPDDLCGRYYRNGPNPQTGDSPHWIVGNGMVHGVELVDGEARWYRNRYVQTPSHKAGEGSPSAMMDVVKGALANTHIISHGGRLLALDELHQPFELSPELETLGSFDFAGKLERGLTAHPKICPNTGEMIAIAYGFTPPFLTYYRIAADGTIAQAEQIEVPGPTLMHEVAATERFVVFLDLSVVADFDSFQKLGVPFRYSEDYGARLGVMPRTGTNADVRWFDIDPCFVFHTMNAFDAGDRVIVEGARYDHLMKQGARDAPALLWRWELDLRTGGVSESQLHDVPVEFPRVPDAYVAQPYRYGYAVEYEQDESLIGKAILKYDREKEDFVRHRLPESRRASEPVFVPRHGAEAEDDGWVMCFVYDRVDDRSDLAIYDASNLEGEPVALVHLPTRVPYGFHGSWVGMDR